MRKLVKVKWLAVAAAALIALLPGCSGTPEIPEATQPPSTQAPSPQEVTIACLDPGMKALLENWPALAAQENLTVQVTEMTIDEYQALPEAERPLALLSDGTAHLDALSDLVEADTFRTFCSDEMDALDQLSSSIVHYKPLCNQGYGYYALPQAAWDDTVGQPDSQVLYFRSDWVGQMEGVNFSDMTWEDFQQIMYFTAREDPDGNSVKDTKALAVAGNLEDWLMDLFGVRDWVLEDGSWIPGAVSNRAKEALAWANQLRKENLLLVRENTTDAVEAFARGEVAMLLWDGTSSGVESLENVWNYVNGEEGDAIEDCVSILPQPATPYGTRYLSVTEGNALMFFSKNMTDPTMTALLRVASRAWEESQSALDVYEAESYAEGVRDEMALSWWPNAWKGPVFANGVLSDAKASLDAQLKAEFDPWKTRIAFSNAFEADWEAWITEAKAMEEYNQALEDVKAQAEARKFFIEE